MHAAPCCKTSQTQCFLHFVETWQWRAMEPSSYGIDYSKHGQHGCRSAVVYRRRSVARLVTECCQACTFAHLKLTYLNTATSEAEN